MFIIGAALRRRYALGVRIDKRGSGNMLVGLMRVDANTGTDPGKSDRTDRCYYISNGIVRVSSLWMHSCACSYVLCGP